MLAPMDYVAELKWELSVMDSPLEIMSALVSADGIEILVRDTRSGAKNFFDKVRFTDTVAIDAYTFAPIGTARVSKRTRASLHELRAKMLPRWMRNMFDGEGATDEA